MGTLRKILLVVLGLVTCIIVAFSFPQKSNTLTEKLNSTHSPNSSGSFGKSIEANETDTADDKMFCIMLEGNRLCAYSNNEDGKKLLHSTEVEPLLMSEFDKEKLNQGIYTSSYEDLLLYFESYSS